MRRRCMEGGGVNNGWRQQRGDVLLGGGGGLILDEGEDDGPFLAEREQQIGSCRGVGSGSPPRKDNGLLHCKLEGRSQLPFTNLIRWNGK